MSHLLSFFTVILQPMIFNFTSYVLGSLSALVYQHTVTSLALPCLLVLPESDPAAPRVTTSAQILQTQGAGMKSTSAYGHLWTSCKNNWKSRCDQSRVNSQWRKLQIPIRLIFNFTISSEQGWPVPRPWTQVCSEAIYYAPMTWFLIPWASF